MKRLNSAGTVRSGTIGFLSDILLMLGLGLMIAGYYALVNQTDSEPNALIRNLFFSASISILLYLLFRLMFIVLNKYLPWENKRLARVLVEIPAIFLISILATVAFTVFFFQLNGEPLSRAQIIRNTSLAVLISLLVNTITEGTAIFRLYRDTLIDRERLKQETLRSHFETLKNQVGPHFLFNSLNTLIALIDESPGTAKDFVQKLSNYYRYVIQMNQEPLVPLHVELSLVRDYVFLLNQRYANRIRLNIELPASINNSLIPPLALQMLVENAEKHNAISAHRHLNIHISTEADCIVVSNNREPKRQAPPGTGTGLENIRKRYELAAHRAVQVQENEQSFRVLLPIIANS